MVTAQNNFNLERVYKQRSYRELIHTYFGLRLPNIKIVVTGTGRVAHGVVEIMNLMGVVEVEPDEYLERKFNYPVYTQIKGHDLYTHKELKTYKEKFSSSPGRLQNANFCLMLQRYFNEWRLLGKKYTEVV